MSKEQEILQKLKRMQRAPIVPCIPAIVKSVEDDNTCTVIFSDGFEQSEVRLKAGIDESKEFFVIKPRPKSTVLVSPLGDETEGNYVVVSVNEIDSLELIFSDEDKVSMRADKEGLEVQYNNNNVSVSADKIELKTKGCVMIINQDNLEIESDYPIAIKATQTDLKEVLEAIVDCSKYMSILTGAAGSISPVAPIHNQFTTKAINLISRLHL